MKFFKNVCFDTSFSYALEICKLSKHQKCNFLKRFTLWRVILTKKPEKLFIILLFRRSSLVNKIVD